MLAVCFPAYPGEPKVYTKWPFDADEAKRRQAETAKALGVEVERDIEIAPGVKMRVVLIPAGEFMMGSPGNEEDRITKDELLHRVRITRPFWLGKYEVTVEQFRAFVQSCRHQTDAEKAGKAFGHYGSDKGMMWANALPDQTDSHPVTCVSWNDAAAFCAWLPQKAGATCQLPTEAHWEYACRAGTSTRYSAGDPDTALRGIANYADADTPVSWADTDHDDGFKYTAPVGRYRANAWGLHDMHGNVSEWCADWYDGNYYGNSPTPDPGGPAEGRYRVLRGGSWKTSPLHCDAATRGGLAPALPFTHVGFRVVLSVK
jgi:formylglycine-generating enzyme required for sulfatase activity